MLFKNVLLLGVCALGFLRAESPEQAVMSAERVWSKALVADDLATLEHVMAADLTYGHASGKTDTKRTYLARIESGAQKYVSFQYDPGTTVRIYGTAAVLNGVAQIVSRTDGKEDTMHLRFLHVYVKQDGEWRLTAHQSVRLPN